MTKLNDVQQQLLDGVRTAFDDVAPVLKKMRDDYEYAVYRAKKPVRDAVVAAQEGTVPMARIVGDATDLRYAQKLKAWLQPAESVIDRVMEGGDAQLAATEAYAEDIEAIESVTRHPSTGKFTVAYKGSEYTVSAMGPDEESWAAVEEGIPPGVYDLISERYPGFVVLDDEDEED